MFTTLTNEDRVAIRNLARRGLAPAEIARELELPEYLVIAGLNRQRSTENRPGLLPLSRLLFWN